MITRCHLRKKCRLFSNKSFILPTFFKLSYTGLIYQPKISYTVYDGYNDHGYNDQTDSMINLAGTKPNSHYEVADPTVISYGENEIW